MTDWTLAACAQVDPDLWFPPTQPSAIVVATCHDCPIRPACRRETLLAEAAAVNQTRQYGYAGGMTAGSRHRVLLRLHINEDRATTQTVAAA